MVHILTRHGARLDAWWGALYGQCVEAGLSLVIRAVPEGHLAVALVFVLRWAFVALCPQSSGAV